MELVWVKDEDNKIMYVNKKYKNKFEDKKYKIIFLDEPGNEPGYAPPGNYKSVGLVMETPSYTTLSNNDWMASHPNGLLLYPPPIGISMRTDGSYAVNDKHRYYTAWHVGMLYITTSYEIPNVPMMMYHYNVLFYPSLYTLSAWLKESNLFETEYDFMEIIPTNESSLTFEPPGKLLGVISMIRTTSNKKFTLCSKLFGTKVRKGDKIETVGLKSGMTTGEVISTRSHATVRLNIDYYIHVKNLFMVTNFTLPGDSGGGCYLIS